MSGASSQPSVSLSLTDRFAAAKRASRALATQTAGAKNHALEAIASALLLGSDRILAANRMDLEAGERNGLSTALQDRLRLDEKRITALADAVLDVAGLTDPVGETVRGSILPNGLQVTQVRVPFGVVGVIYEARPNVTVDIAALALKSGNAAVLRGGTAAENSNRVLVEILQEALASAGLPADAVQTIDEFGREGARELMRARDYIDVLIPRGARSSSRPSSPSPPCRSSRPAPASCTSSSTRAPTPTSQRRSCSTRRPSG
ncbi:hypothetical protein GCM10025866_24810 [Naasia aerilata]|uniref:Aldehyde dehydrogenase domain-containing protein n=1 Tax=Naasia aerilata TaxID=1162966 RepID=A0ABN6XNK6_9MICO|nr:hypothetical protein GCM10025866_24810 [Naasia aerilata]